MALAKLGSVSLRGIEAIPVLTEVDVATGLPAFLVVGLADKAVDESRERVRSALKHSGFDFPISRITVNLSPSEIKKTGVHFDLPIALALLIADEQIKTNDRLKDSLFIGGLSLDGTLQGISGTLVMTEWAKREGIKNLILPKSNFHEATLIRGINLVPCQTLNEVIDWINGQFEPSCPKVTTRKSLADFDADWLQVQGQQKAKRAAVVAASGAHNLLLEGPPGAGKTLLARAIRAILPPLIEEELIEVVKLYSIAGQLVSDQDIRLVGRPFRTPHHSASTVSVIGGGTHPKPGEISLAHKGILFLDELPEFPRSVIESLRQPLEDGQVFVSRIQAAIRYPAQFILVGTMNPCPCGWLGSHQKECQCTPHLISQYRKKISGPIIDRIDIYLQVPAVNLEQLKKSTQDYNDLTLAKEQVGKSWDIQRKRNKGKLNSFLAPKEINEICSLTDEADRLLDQAAQKMVITGRGYHKILKIARTIADLDQKSQIEATHLAEALQYRFHDFSQF